MDVKILTLEVGSLVIKVDGVLTVPYGKFSQKNFCEVNFYFS